MKNWKHAIEGWFADQEDVLVQRIARLVAVPSVGGADAGIGKPFGKGPAQALETAVQMAAEAGLQAKNVDGYVMTADVNEYPDGLHVLAHLDVVTPGDGWDTDPYTVVRQGDLIFGRGVDDDKGPAVCAMMALECVKALKIPLRRNVKLILGTDEETGSRDIAYFYSKTPYAPYTLSPDAEFPVINIEKGNYKPTITRQWAPETALPRVTAFHGGVRINVAPRNAEAVVKGLDCTSVTPLAAELSQTTGTQIEVVSEGDGVRVICIGREAHASTPDEGINAITALLALLSRLPLAVTASTESIRALAELFPHGDNHGGALGIDQADSESGRITVALSLLELDETGLSGRFDARTPLCATPENCEMVVEKRCRDRGFFVVSVVTPPHKVAQDSPLIQTLLHCYEVYTGKTGRCVAIGGGTYVHSIPGGVAFGAGDFEFDSRLHSANERARVSALLMAAKIYAAVIAVVCGGET